MRGQSLTWACLAGSLATAQAQFQLEENVFDTSYLTARQAKAAGKKGVMMMNRFALKPPPDLFIANSDGTNAGKFLGNSSHHDYHASFSQDGQFVVFTSERNGLGNADLFRARANGSDI
ncbi:hypothetical protein CLAFUW4_07487 [Fulvia fulva]|uniref:Uncharacterized protein n=1 Tax=Passalora fulva TaxID=5499 RepID=A0A9Q8LIZ8_PASFU|nr:uncharacterized protein CLAFUR5_07617 [Fulvia fulva]KAK4621473.1 hypothetical protein CLAFUR4_07493 [Fulvia fulva]KAK4622578.1 hypothetical protein CLAFUR0_07493 [Fulvia fulva]UJO18516.1 hypothetical protein CLAFUR5_07617 [Fulvia fulva]WPV16455.1 hypothetical protein CLAFUW4_07487 [Fulvia fulva]WPV30885.1 hypothetical protein CLAFUW7_07489 [Fulvia fulva]